MSNELNIAPSILSADFGHLMEDISKVEKCCKYLHIDVMDGHFVNNISFGIPVIKSIRPKTDMFFDVHLMVDNPEMYLELFSDAGADAITFHIECAKEPRTLISRIKAQGKKAGIAIHPSTPVEAVFPYINDLDIILLMSVIPGHGGQKFMPEAESRLSAIREAIDKEGASTILSVDGGINRETSATAYKAGARLLVAGSAVFCADDPVAAVEELLCRAKA